MQQQPRAEAAKGKPSLSAIICTRNRGDSIAEAVRTVLANDHPDFELLVIDQSTDGRTAEAVAPYRADARLRYIPSPTKGLGRARNIGLAEARAGVIAFTDDDCSVPANWLRVMEDSINRDPRITVLFCNVLAGEHDSGAGFIPGHRRHDRVIVKSFFGRCRNRGMGAGMAVRRNSILAIGGFDEELGAGGLFPSAEDTDIALRAISKGQWVCETDEVAVTHHGFRDWSEARQLAARDWQGLGAAYMKLLRAGHPRASILWIHDLAIHCLLEPLSEMLRFRRPRGLARPFHFIRGGLKSLTVPVDKSRIVYSSQR